MMNWGRGITLFIMMIGVCSVAFAAPLQLKPVSPISSVKPATPTALQPVMKTVVPVVAKTGVSAVNPRVLKLQSGDPAKQVSLAGSALDKATSAQLLQNNRPATGMNVQLLGGSPGMRPVRISATSSAAAGNYSLRLVAGMTRIDVPLTTFSVLVAKAVQTLAPAARLASSTPAVAKLAGSAPAVAQPTMAVQPTNPMTVKPVAPIRSVKTMPIKPVAPKVPTVQNGNLANAAGSALNPMLMNKSLMQVTRPAAGYVSCKGKTQPIQWSRDTSDLGPVKITLRAYNQDVKVIANSTTDIGQYDWLIPDDPALGSPNYTIRVQKVADSTKFGDSGQFNISVCDVTQAGVLPQGEQATLGGGTPVIPTGGGFSAPGVNPQPLTLGSVKLLEPPSKGLAKYVVDAITYASHGLTTKSPDSLKVGTPITLVAECPTGSSLRKLDLFTLGGLAASEQWTGNTQKAQKMFHDFELASATAIKSFHCTDPDVLHSSDITVNIVAELTCEAPEVPPVRVEASLPYPVQLTCDTRLPHQAPQTVVEWEHICPDPYVIDGTSKKSLKSRSRDANDPMLCRQPGQ